MKKKFKYVRLNMVYYLTAIELRLVGFGFIIGYMVKHKKIFRKQTKEKVEEMKELLQTLMERERKQSKR